MWLGNVNKGYELEELEFRILYRKENYLMELLRISWISKSTICKHKYLHLVCVDEWLNGWLIQRIWN